MKTWQSTPASVSDPAELARQIAEKVDRFDRRIWWRNAREYAACLILLILTSRDVMQGRPAAIIMAAAAVVVAGSLWWKHRRTRPLDPGADARTYQAAMLKRYDDQIAVTTSAKYWYWIPLYVPVIWITWARWQHDPQRAAILFASATAVFVLLWWINDRFVLRKIKDARRKMAEMIQTD